MTYLWQLFSQAALVLAIVTGAYVCFGLVRWVLTDPKGFGYRVCGHLALAFGGLAVLWLAVLGELREWW